MPVTGVVFDFNGTLFWDTPLHNRAWDMFLAARGYGLLSDDAKTHLIHGKNNHTIFEDLFHKRIGEAELERLSEEKESIYREISLAESPGLAAGAADLLSFLAEHNHKHTIATASGLKNVEFFFELLGLARWFDLEKVVYDNGIIRGKPAPDYYLKAAALLETAPGDCLVFEDSYAGINSARNAGIGTIIIVNSTGQEYGEWDLQVISDFGQVDRNLFSQ